MSSHVEPRDRARAGNALVHRDRLLPTTKVEGMGVRRKIVRGMKEHKTAPIPAYRRTRNTATSAIKFGCTVTFLWPERK